MKLATKLVSIFMLLILLVIAVDGWWSVREETAQYERMERREIVRLATTLRTTLRLAAHTQDEILQLVEQMNEEWRHLRCRWVWFAGEGGPRPHAAIAASDVRAADSGILFPVELRERHLRLAYVHVAGLAERPAALEVEADADTMTTLRTAETIRALRLAGVLVMLSGVVGVFFGHRLIAAPLRQLIDKTQRIGHGDLSGPVLIRGNDELGELGDALNRMCDDLETSRAETAEEQTRRMEAVEQLRHFDRLRTVGQLAAGIAHEMGTPLNVVSGRAAMIAAGRLDRDATVESAHIIKEQSERISTIVRQLLDFARTGALDRSVVDVRLLVERTVELLAPMATKTGVELSVHAPDQPVEARIDASQVQQVLTNLVVNAIQALPDGGPVSVRVASVIARSPEVVHAGEQPCVRLDVEDCGAGIAADLVDRVFDPFFTTKDVGQGTGMGLSVAYGIVHEHGGWIGVDSVEGRGSRFSVFLPREPAS